MEAALGAGTDLDGVVASYTLRAVFEKGDGKFGDVNRENFSAIADELRGLADDIRPIAGHILGQIVGINLQ